MLNLFSSKGTINRIPYIIIISILCILSYIILKFINSNYEFNFSIFNLITSIILFLFLLVTYKISIKRAHSMNRSSLIVIFGFVLFFLYIFSYTTRLGFINPYITLILNLIFIWLVISPRTVTYNKYDITNEIKSYNRIYYYIISPFSFLGRIGRVKFIIILLIYLSIIMITNFLFLGKDESSILLFTNENIYDSLIFILLEISNTILNINIFNSYDLLSNNNFKEFIYNIIIAIEVYLLFTLISKRMNDFDSNIFVFIGLFITATVVYNNFYNTFYIGSFIFLIIIFILFVLPSSGYVNSYGPSNFKTEVLLHDYLEKRWNALNNSGKTINFESIRDISGEIIDIAVGGFFSNIASHIVKDLVLDKIISNKDKGSTLFLNDNEINGFNKYVELLKTGNKN